MPFVAMHSRIVYTASREAAADKLERIRKKSGTDPHTDCNWIN